MLSSWFSSGLYVEIAPSAVTNSSTDLFFRSQIALVLRHAVETKQLSPHQDAIELVLLWLVCRNSSIGRHQLVHRALHVVVEARISCIQIHIVDATEQRAQFILEGRLRVRPINMSLRPARHRRIGGALRPRQLIFVCCKSAAHHSGKQEKQSKNAKDFHLDSGNSWAHVS